MKLNDLLAEGFILKSWFITTVRNERMIAVKLSKESGRHHYYHYITHAPCSERALKDAEFIQPILLDNIARA